MARHAREATPQQQLEKAVGNAILFSFLAQVVALATGRVPWPSIVVGLVAVSYLVEAAGQWRALRTEAEDAELEALLDAEDALLLQPAS